MIGALLLAATIGIGDFLADAHDTFVRKIREDVNSTSSDVSLSGSVTYAAEGRFFLQQGSEAVKVVYEVGKLPTVGSKVVARGFPALEGGRVVFVANQVVDSGSGVIPPAVAVSGDDLIYGGQGGVNWRRVELTGRAIERTDRGFAIKSGEIPITVICRECPYFIKNCGETHPFVKVTGIVETLLDQSSLFGAEPYVIGVKLNVADPSQIELIEDAVYLKNCHRYTVEKLAITVSIILFFGVIVFIWIMFRQQRRNVVTSTLMAERKRMADDIHDTIEQHLVGAGMLLQLGRTKETREILLRAKSELRDIIWGLKNDDMVRLTPEQMLRETAILETKKGIFRVTTKLLGMPGEMSVKDKRDLSLIVREAIGNAVKHGNAKKIAITSDPLENGGWVLRIANDGLPFDPLSAPGVEDGHFGLSGMRERSRRIGADVEIYAKNGWMVIKLEFPGNK